MILQTYVNKETGEILEVIEHSKNFETDSDWKKAFCGRILYEVDELVNNNAKLLLWLFDNMDSQNRIIENYITISKKSNIPLISVRRGMKRLLDKNIIQKVQTGVYMLNPSLIAGVNSDKRANLLVRYNVLRRTSM